MPTRPKTHSQRKREKSPFKAFYEKMQKEQQKKYDKKRGTAAERGYGGRWQKARLGYLKKHPLCVYCLRVGKVKEAELVDHIQPHKGDYKLFWDSSNWQSLCNECHNTIKRKEEKRISISTRVARLSQEQR